MRRRPIPKQAREAGDGFAALVQARQAHPDLILLDVTMPRMDGQDFLAQVKADPRLKDIPVIVVSGVGETQVAVKCIEMGAEDFVHKPFQPALLRARMRSSLERARLREAERSNIALLETQRLELEERVQQRTRELADAHERLKGLDRAKDDFLRLLSHELRTPMTGVIGATEALGDPALDRASRSEAVRVLQASVERLHRMVEDALLLTTVRVSGPGSSLAPHPLEPIVSAASVRVSGPAGRRGVRIGPLGADDWVLCARGLLVDAMAVLLDCAVKFSADGEIVGITSRREGGSVSVRISATGPGIPEGVQGRFFDILAVREPLTPGGDLGLGPPVAAELIRLLGGRATVESGARGVCFVVTLRAAEPAATDGR